MNRAFLDKVQNRLLTLFISLSGAFTIIFAIRDALPAGYIKELTVTLLFISCLDIISILVDDLFVSEKATGLTYLRYLVYVNIILFLIIKFCKPIVSTGLIWVGTNAAIVLSYFIKQMSGFYETFTSHTAGMSGKELSSDLTENSWFVSDYINSAKKLIWGLFITSLLMCGIILALHLAKGSASVAVIISFCCFIAGYIILIIIHRANEQETSFAFLGHVAIFTFRKQIITLCLLLCLTSIGAGAIISSDTALLKPEYFSWLLKLFPSQDIPSELMQNATAGAGNDQMMDIDKDFYGEKEDSFLTIILHWFFIILEYIVIAAIIAGIIFFLFSAFFSKKWKEFWKDRKLNAFLKSAWMKLKQLVHDLLHMKRQKTAYNTVEAAHFRDTMKSLLSGVRKSKEKRAELDALTKKFMQLVDYAASKGVSFKPHMAPLEFARLLENDDALVAGRLFEQALYARELLSKEERTMFEESIAAACR